VTGRSGRRGVEARGEELAAPAEPGRVGPPVHWRDRLAAAVREGRRTGALPLLAVLLLPIPFLLVAHQLHYWDVWPFYSERWIVNGDRTVIEIFGYVQLAVAAVLLAVVGRRQHQGPVYAAWAATLVVVVIDDSMRLHERGGGWLVRRDLVPELLGLRPQALGELLTWVLIGIPVLVLLFVAHRASAPGAQADSWRLAALMVLLMAFGLGVDVVHELIEELTDNGVVDLLVTFVESGGELGAMSALLAYAFHLLRRPAVAIR